MSDTQSAPSDANGTGLPLSVGEAADILGVSPDTVRAHLRQGTLAGEKIDDRWVVYLAGTAPPDEPTVVPAAGQDQVVATAPAPMPAPARSGTTVLLVALIIRLLQRLRLAARRVRP